jgi:hypothetical protein
MNKLDRLISIVHNLKEEGMSVGAVSGPTNNTGSGPEGAGYGGSAQGFKSSYAGYDKPLGRDGRSKLMRRLPPAYRKFFANKKSRSKKG